MTTTWNSARALLKITPGDDPNDYDMGKKRDLEFINIMNKDGTMSANAQAYAGLDRAECRVKIWEDLEKDGLAIKKEDYETRVPRDRKEVARSSNPWCPSSGFVRWKLCPRQR